MGSNDAPALAGRRTWAIAMGTGTDCRPSRGRPELPLVKGDFARPSWRAPAAQPRHDQEYPSEFLPSPFFTTLLGISALPQAFFYPLFGWLAEPNDRQVAAMSFSSVSVHRQRLGACAKPPSNCPDQFSGIAWPNPCIYVTPPFADFGMIASMRKRMSRGTDVWQAILNVEPSSGETFTLSPRIRAPSRKAFREPR